MIPSELGRLTNLEELIFDTMILQPVQSEVQYAGVEAFIKFLSKLGSSRGVRHFVCPMPGLKWGDIFNANFDAQVYTPKIPKGTKGRDEFTSYLPLVDRRVRADMVHSGYDFMRSTAVGNVLDLSNCQLTKCRLVAVKGTMLDDVPDDFYMRGTVTAPPSVRELERASSSNDDALSPVSSSDTASTSGSSVFRSIFGSAPKAVL